MFKEVNTAAPKPGEFFRGLRVHSKLGEGAMGAAYLASHPILQMPLVVKTFKFLPAENDFREAQLSARITSPNVVAVLDAGHENGVPFIVQKYIDGIDIAELSREAIACGWHPPLSALSRILVDTARGIHAIHQAGVLHGDIKPANLFLQGNGVTAVGDFGIAKDVVQNDGKPQFAGSPPYMAPEQWDGHVCAESDIYSLGVTAHLLATAELPFKGSSMKELREAHAEKPYIPPSSKDPRSAYLFAMVQRTLCKKPEERYSTGEAFARELEAINDSIPRFIRLDNSNCMVGHLRVSLMEGDLSAETADVLVSASNTTLVMNIGVSAALLRRAGRRVEREAIAQGPCAMGGVVWTGAGDVRARFIAHAVAALDGAVCLQRATLRVLLGAEKRSCSSISFPALGTGAGSVPMDLAAKLMLEAMNTFAFLGPKHVRTIRIILRDAHALKRWQAVLASMT